VQDILNSRTDFSDQINNEIEDIACSFIEEEIGHYDWRHNWLVTKSAGTARNRVEQWLKSVNSTLNPDDLVRYLDTLASSRCGRWI
jgi:hypothetical protein